MAENNIASDPGARRMIGRVLGIGIIAAAAVMIVVTLVQWEIRPQTDDATVRANFVGIAPQVNGHIVVIDLGRPVSTPAVFARVDRSLTPRENSNTIFRFVSSDLEGLRAFSILANDLEGAALEEAPELAEPVERIRGILVRGGAALASLSGSGSSFFGLFDDGRRAQGAQSALRAAGFIVLRAQTVSLNQYRRMWARSLGNETGARSGEPVKEPAPWRSRTSRSSRSRTRS